ITGSFGLPLAMIQWVIICYVLTHAGLMLAFGRAGDIWSHGSVLRAGLAWSTVAFILCALAPSFGWLLFFRFLQGIGAGLIISCAPAVVTSLYPETRRAHALGIFTLMFALGSAVGPLIAAAAASLAAFLRWESRIAHPIVQIALFRNRAFAAITLAGVLMYLVSFSVLLIVPYFFVRYTALPLPLAGALLATGFAAMAAVSPGAGWLVGRIAAERIAPLGALVTGLGLF